MLTTAAIAELIIAMAQPLSLPLFPESLPAPSPEPAPRRLLPEREWLAIYCHRLSLEALGVAPRQGQPMALLEGAGRNARIKDCTLGAARLGVQPGQTLSAALALAPALQTVNRDEQREDLALSQLAKRTQRFTPTISLERPDSLLLEVAGSLHLFGGRAGMLEHARRLCLSSGFSSRLALAPTPLASLWLAHATKDTHIASADSLRSSLGGIPIGVPAWPVEWQAGFRRLGIKQLRDLLRLPREGLARRFDPALVQELDQALGLLPDPRDSWRESAPCRLKRELPAESDRLEWLAPYIGSLVEELAVQLRARDAGVDVIWLLFKHFSRPPTRCRIASLTAHRDQRRWRELVDLRLQQQIFPEPVNEIRLVSGRLQRHVPLNCSLIRDRKNAAEELSKLLGLLQARLGQGAVYGVACSDDPRPEHAWNKVKPGEANREQRDWAERPLLLLPLAQSLACRDGRPLYRGAPLAQLCQQERIDGAWWEDEYWQRDYYQAQAGDGRRLWVYRQGGAWFLHGFFA